MTTRRPLFTVDPVGLDFKAWADAVVGINESSLSAPIPPDNKFWMEWAVHVAAPDYVIPSPYIYGDWISWANAFNQSLSASGR